MAMKMKSKMVVNTTTPAKFKRSVKEFQKGNFTFKEKMALVLAQNRAKAQLKRKTLSEKERKQFTEIAKVKITKKKGGK